MAVLTVANSQLGFPCLDENGTFSSSKGNQRLYFVYGFHRPVRYVTGKSKRTRGFAVVRAMAGGVIEKETDFKPSFEDYLKAMETVKSRREKRNRKSDEQLVELSVAEKGLKDGEASRKWSHGRLDSKESERVVRSKAKGDLKTEERIGKFEFQEGFIGEKFVPSKQEEMKRKWNRKELDLRDAQVIVRGKLKDVSKTEESNGKFEFQEGFVAEKFVPLKQDEMKRKWNRKELDITGVQETEEMHGENLVRSNMMKRGTEISSLRSGNTKMDIGVKVKRVNHVKKLKGKSRVVEDSKDDSLEIERAAFKSLEEFGNISDQPRVSRVDMEDRIQRLAKGLNGAPIDSPEWSFSKMMRSAQIRFADHSIIRLIQILGKYGNWRRVLQVMEWMQSRERFKAHRIRNIYTAALNVLGRERRPVEALNLFYAMQENMSSYPDLIAYHCIAVTLGQAGHLKELFDVIDSMKSPPRKKLATSLLQKWDPRLEPDIIVYNAVLNACVQRKNLDGAFWVLQQLKQQYLKPTATTYGLVMEVMFTCDKHDLVHEFFRKMKKSFIPNSLTYKVLVKTLWKEGKVDEAVRVVRDMERRGIVGSSGLYYDLARCLCSGGRCQEALMQIEKICKVADKPLVVTYTGLIQTCLDSGDIESGIYIFDQMHKFCSPNLVTCNIMLKGYLDHHRFDDARLLFQKLLQGGTDVTSKDDYKHVMLPDVHTFNLMLDACVVNQRWEELEYYYMKMLQHGFHYNAKRHSHMLLEACRVGKVKLLEETWKHLVQRGQVPSPLLVKEMFRLKLEQDDYAAAFACIDCLPSSESHKFSQKFWLNFLRDNLQQLKEEKLFGLLVDMDAFMTARSGSPNEVVCNFMKSCKEILRMSMSNDRM